MFSIIVVHGVKTAAAQDLPNNWAKILSQVAPQNSAVFSFDVNFTAGEGFIWQTFAQRAAALLDAIIQRYHGNADRHSRAPLFIGYTLSGLVIKRVSSLLLLAFVDHASLFFTRTLGAFEDCLLASRP